MALVASVVIEKTAFSYDKLYDYFVPESLSDLQIGCRVTVPFGNGNMIRQGIVMGLKQSDEIDGLKRINSLEDANPVLSEEMVKLCSFMRERTFCTYFDAVRCMLPAGLGIKIIKSYSLTEADFDFDSLSSDEQMVVTTLKNAKSPVSETDLLKTAENESVIGDLLNRGVIIRSDFASRRMGDATQKMARLTSKAESYKATTRQKEVISVLTDAGVASVKEICYFTGVTAGVVTNLADKGVIELFDEEIFRSPYERNQTCKKTEIVLNKEQKAAFDGLEKLYSSDEASVALLYGVTGSGKTQVYLSLVDKAVNEGKNVIVMVPEISLTPQTLRIFNVRYGDKIALFHSAMSLGQRMDEWKRVKNGLAKVAIGTRSAVFAPFDKVALIIVDEEQEHTYKSEQSPRFDAREIAKFRVVHSGGLLVLSSATPSIESYSAAKSGKYSLFTIKHRYNSKGLPEVVTVDMRGEILSGHRGSVSSVLQERLMETLNKKEQAIILLNRRGHNSFVSCPTCGETEKCPNCSISLTYHSANKRLMCHYCGYSTEFNSKCSSCSSEHIRLMGIGTQLVEDELNGLFPDARVLRMDADSTMTRNSYANNLTAFAEGKYDIMLGTQMVAKGLDFEKVTLVGVIGADQAMYSDDYRSYEKTFSLLTQVIGRSGRSGKSGTAVVQTVAPDSEVIKRASKQDYEAFYEEEILTRKLMIYPPFCDIAVVAVSAVSNETAQSVINDMFDGIKALISDEYKDVKLVILGPKPAAVPRVNNKYRYRMIIKCKNNRRFRDMLRSMARICGDKNRNKDYSFYIDIDPERII